MEEAVDLRPLKIIYLDDHFLYSKAVGNHIINKFPLARMSYFCDGSNALTYLLHALEKKEKIDLFITDVMHPGMDGITLANHIRQKEPQHRPAIPFLFITINADRSIVQKIEEIPFTKYLQRHAQWDEIAATLDNIFRKHPA